MATYYVDDGGDNTNGSSWATAYTSVSALDDAVALASGDIVYIGHDHICQYTHAASRTITCPSSGQPVVFISVTQGSNPPTYQASSTNQIDTSEGAYSLTIDGSFSLHGIQIKTGGNLYLYSDIDELGSAYNCTFKLGAHQQIYFTTNSHQILKSCTIDCSLDTSAVGNYALQPSSTKCRLYDCTWTSASYRTSIFPDFSGFLEIYGCDFSSFHSTNTCLVEFLGGGGVSSGGVLIASNCKLPATVTAYQDNQFAPKTDIRFINCAFGDAPTSLYHMNYFGTLISSSSVYRVSGATIDGYATSWLITTGTYTGTTTSQDTPYFTPEIYGYISSTGSKTFDLYITNDTADFNDSEVWLEVDYKATSGSGEWTTITDKVASRTATAAAQTDDTTSNWYGSGISFTYKQKLSVTATVNQTGMFRARVAIGVQDIQSTRKFYIDPIVIVS